jgi:RNA polymerase sigma factor (sigma-70 family)
MLRERAAGRGSGAVADAAQGPGEDDESIVELIPLLRRVVAARIRDPDLVDDLVQEAIARVMAARLRIEGDALAPYAVRTARNLVAEHARNNNTARSKAHLLLATDEVESPGERVLKEEDQALLATALTRLSLGEQDLLLAHEVQGRGLRTIAEDTKSTAGAVAAALNRARARLRVEYLLAQEGLEPSADRCRPVLRAVSLGDRRRQRELDAEGHLLECEVCSRIGTELLERRGQSEEEASEIVVSIKSDADVVTAREKGRQLGVHAGFGATDATLLATAISEMARNVVKFAVRGEARMSTVSTENGQGVKVVVRDTGPGIRDLEQAMRVGYSTYQGLGLGLPGTKRLMDQFDVVTEEGKGTTVTMTKWRTQSGVSASGASRSDGEE